LLDQVAAEIRRQGQRCRSAGRRQPGRRLREAGGGGGQGVRTAGYFGQQCRTSATGEFESVTDDIWQADFELKLFAAIRLARLAIRT